MTDAPLPDVLAAVLALHVPNRAGRLCRSCGVLTPCPTVRAVKGEPHVAAPPEPTAAQVAAFKAAWEQADATARFRGVPGARTREGLRAALAVAGKVPEAPADGSIRLTHEEAVLAFEGMRRARGWAEGLGWDDALDRIRAAEDLVLRLRDHLQAYAAASRPAQPGEG